MTADPVTIAFYEKQAPHYTLSTAQDRHRHLDPFLARLAPSARILELGCGGGRDAAHMAQTGFDVDATDGVTAMVRKARERTGLPVRVLRFEALDAQAEYDAVWAHACLLHVAQAMLPSLLAAIHRALRPGGWHFANYKLGPAGEEGDGRDRLGRLHNFPRGDWLEKAYRDAGFTVVDAENYAGSASDGTQHDWLALTVQRP